MQGNCFHAQFYIIPHTCSQVNPRYFNFTLSNQRAITPLLRTTPNLYLSTFRGHTNQVLTHLPVSKMNFQSL